MSNTTFIALVRVAIELITSSNNYYSNSPWARVVKMYALELLDKFEESHGATEHPTMEALLDGAAGWLEYSMNGMALVYQADLRERFSDTAYAGHEEGCAYLEAQASALSNAAYLILDAVIKVEQNPRYYIGRVINNEEEEENMPNNEHEVQCVYCGAMVPESEAADTWEGWVCDDCYEEHYTICEHCDNEVETSETIMVHTGSYRMEAWCPACVENDAFRCDGCDEFFSERNYDSHYLLGRTLCDACYEDEMDDYEEDDEYAEEQYYGEIESFVAPDGVVSYGFKPRPCPCCTAKEMGVKVNSYSRRPLVPLLGFELEMEDHDEYGRDLNDDANFMNEELGFTYCKHDSSLTRGIELVSHPCTINFLMEKKPIFDRVFADMRGNGYTSHDNGRCGLHVHISKQPLVEANENAMNNMLIVVDTLWEPLMLFSRRTEAQLDHWAARYSTKDDLPTETAKKAKRRGRYMAVNLQNNHTVEIRMMRGTLRLETFIATLQLIQRLIDVSISIDDPENAKYVTWDELIGHEYKELNDYVEARFGSCPGYIPSAEETEEEPEEEAEVEAVTEPEIDHGTPSLLLTRDIRPGDIVEVVYNYRDGLTLGDTGKVVAVNATYVGVQFDHPIFAGCDLDGRTDNGLFTGAWVFPHNLEIKVPQLYAGDRVRVKPGTLMADVLGDLEGEVLFKKHYEFEGEERCEVGVSFEGWNLGHDLDGWTPDDSGLWFPAEELIRTRISPDVYVGQRVRFDQDGYTREGTVKVIPGDNNYLSEVGVEVDIPFYGHDLCGRLDNTRGWWVTIRNIVPLTGLGINYPYEP